MSTESNARNGTPGVTRRGSPFGIFVGPAFFGLAAWLWLGPSLTEIPARPDVRVDARRITTAPRRATVGDPPTIRVNSFDRVCTDCHGIFPITQQQIENRMQHRHVVLDHGINDKCHNCHDVRDMNRLVLRDGSSISFSDVPELCRKCHGPTYHDWEHGIHGRINGHWDAGRGEQHKLRCIECHDPHRPRHPAMDPLAPLPGPHTLRMGEPGAAHPEDYEPVEADPLRRASMGETRTEEHR